MTDSPRSVPNAETLVPRTKARWLWFGVLLALLAVASASITACSTTPVADAEVSTALPDEISVEAAYDVYQEGVFLLDVRTRQEWDEFHAPGTTLIPLDELESRLDELPRNQEIVVICRSGNRSQVGRDILRTNGFGQTTSMAGGLKAWAAASYPIE